MTLPTQLAYLRHVRDALLAVLEYTGQGRAGFFASKMVPDAVLRNLEVIGEAVKRLDEGPLGRGSSRVLTRPVLFACQHGEG
jgi:hypothetical protein